MTEKRQIDWQGVKGSLDAVEEPLYLVAHEIRGEDETLDALTEVVISAYWKWRTELTKRRIRASMKAD